MAADNENTPPPAKPAGDTSAGDKTVGDQSAGGKPCVICGKPALARHKPFCSARCADIDLGRWLKGSYVIPGDPVDETESDRRDTDEEH